MRIPAFRFSTRNKSPAAYRDRLSVLAKKYGVEFSFRSNAKLTPQRKGAITRKLRKVVEFLNPENSFQFVEAPPSELKKLRRKRGAAKQQITGKGVFVPVAKTGKRKTRIRIKDGEIRTRTGRFTSHFRLYPSAEVVADPKMIVEEAKELGAEQVFISLKGHRSKTGYTLKRFGEYLEHVIIPDIEEAEENDGYIDRIGKKSAFQNWFGAEFVSHDWK